MAIIAGAALVALVAIDAMPAQLVALSRLDDRPELTSCDDWVAQFGWHRCGHMEHFVEIDTPEQRTVVVTEATTRRELGRLVLPVDLPAFGCPYGWYARAIDLDHDGVDEILVRWTVARRDHIIVLAERGGRLMRTREHVFDDDPLRGDGHGGDASPLYASMVYHRDPLAPLN